jgi:hypothetical protein
MPSRLRFFLCIKFGGVSERLKDVYEHFFQNIQWHLVACDTWRSDGSEDVDVYTEDAGGTAPWNFCVDLQDYVVSYSGRLWSTWLRIFGFHDHHT